MAEQKAKPAAKKVAVTKVASKAAGKPKITKAAAPPQKIVAKKAATAAAKPKNTKTPAVKKAAAPAAVKKTPAQLTPEERYRMVQTAAYFIAERNGFGGCSADHWVAAELEIAGKLGQ